LSKRKVQTPAFRRADFIAVMPNRSNSPPHLATVKELWTIDMAVMRKNRIVSFFRMIRCLTVVDASAPLGIYKDWTWTP
jgi:hypothetical protein